MNFVISLLVLIVLANLTLGVYYFLLSNYSLAVVYNGAALLNLGLVLNALH